MFCLEFDHVASRDNPPPPRVLIGQRMIFFWPKQAQYHWRSRIQRLFASTEKSFQSPLEAWFPNPPSRFGLQTSIQATVAPVVDWVLFFYKESRAKKVYLGVKRLWKFLLTYNSIKAILKKEIWEREDGWKEWLTSLALCVLITLLWYYTTYTIFIGTRHKAILKASILSFMYCFLLPLPFSIL